MVKRKMFIVKYYFKNDLERNIKILLTRSANRTKAEKRCRDIEYPEKINIKNIRYVWL